VPADHSCYRFGPFELDTDKRVLSRGEKRVKLQDLPFRLLVMLVEHPGEIIPREEVCKRLWPDNTFVEFDRSLGVAVRKVREALNDDAEAPRYVETIPRRGYRFLAPVTQESDNRSRAASVTTPATDSPRSSLAVHSGLERYLIVTAIVTVTVGVGLYILRSGPRHAPTTADARTVAPPPRIRRSIAVLGFRNLPGRREDSWLSAAFSEMLNTELAAGGDLRMVSGEDVARAKSELPLADEDSLAKATLERLRINPGADVVVLGSYTLLPGPQNTRLRLDLRMQDTVSGETLAEEALTGDGNDLFDLAQQAGQSLRHNLGLPPVSSETTLIARAAIPSNETAARLYAEGRARLWAFDFRAARDLFTKAIASDPAFPLAHAGLSDALWHSGYEVKALAEAQKAVELSTQLSQEQRLLVEGQYRKALGDWPKAIEAYRSLFRLFPDSLDYGLLLAATQIHVKSSDALQTLALLRHLPPPAGDDARIDMTEASAWIGTDLDKARTAAQRAIAKATAQGSHVIVGRTYGFLCQQDPARGASQEALSECESAVQGGIAAKDVNGESLMRTDLAAIYYLRGDLVGAEKMLRKAVAGFHQVGNPSGAASASSNIADLLILKGDLSAAKKLLEDCIADYQTVEDKEGIALNLDSLGDIARLRGNLTIAETTYQQSKAIAQEINDKDAVAYAFTGLGDLYFDRSDFPDSRNAYEQALTLRKQLGEKQLAAESQTALARLSIEEGHAADAEKMALESKQLFRQDHEADDELFASQVLIDALLAQGKVSEAQQEVQASSAQAAKSQNIMFRLAFALSSARVLLAEEHPERAHPSLEHIQKEAHAHELVYTELETRVALAQLARKMGHGAAAKAELSSLEASARVKGFGSVLRHSTDEN